MENSKFKVGDKVVLLNNDHGCDLEIGKPARVILFDGSHYKILLEESLSTYRYCKEYQLKMYKEEPVLVGIEKQIDMLNKLSISTSYFYAITIKEDMLRLQGHLNAELILLLLNNKDFKQVDRYNGYLEFDCDRINIVLT